jgi:hypothetical protein
MRPRMHATLVASGPVGRGVASVDLSDVTGQIVAGRPWQGTSLPLPWGNSVTERLRQPS